MLFRKPYRDDCNSNGPLYDFETASDAYLRTITEFRFQHDSVLNESVACTLKTDPVIMRASIALSWAWRLINEAETAFTGRDHSEGHLSSG